MNTNKFPKILKNHEDTNWEFIFFHSNDGLVGATK
jgi:hypothetical protein